MAKLRVHNFTISLDGYGAGPHQALTAPMGEGTEHLHDWFKRTAMWAEMVGDGPGETGPDDVLARQGDEGIGATLMGRNMFGPIRDAWPADDTWTGWWGPEPPYGHDVFVLTHHDKPSLAVGATTFHFVGDLQEARTRALEAAGGLDVRVGGGVSTVQQLLALGQLDHVHLAISPLLLGVGERLFADGLVVPEGYRVTRIASSDHAAHVVLTRDDG